MAARRDYDDIVIIIIAERETTSYSVKLAATRFVAATESIDFRSPVDFS